jgi:hypothetical protein
LDQIFSIGILSCIFRDDSKVAVEMSKAIKILNITFILILIAIFTACAPAKKNPYYEKRKKSSQVNASQLGRNRYYFSKDYQKKLNKTFKKK